MPPLPPPPAPFSSPALLPVPPLASSTPVIVKVPRAESWNPPAAYPPEPVSADDRVGYSPEIEDGRLDVDDVIRPIYEEAGEALGKEFPYPEKE